MQLQDYDFIEIMETWWDLNDWNADMNGYLFILKDKPAKQDSDVALYVREQLESIEICLKMNDEQMENLRELRGRLIWVT